MNMDMDVHAYGCMGVLYAHDGHMIAWVYGVGFIP